MFLNSWRWWLNPGRFEISKQKPRHNERRGRERFRPRLEGLECRIVPSLTLTNNADSASVFAGQNISYTITVQSNINDTNVTINDPTPANTTFVSASQTGGATTYTFVTPPVGGTGNVVWSTGALPAGELDTFRLTLKISSGTTAATVTNMVRGTSQNQPAPGVRATSSVTVSASADVAITKIGSTAPVTEGTPVTYTLTVTNNGPSDAQGVVVTDTVPAGATVNSLTFSQGKAVSIGVVTNATFNLGTVAAGATVTGTAVVTFSEEGSQTDTAAVSSTTADPNSANNSSTATTSVTEGAFTGSGFTLNGNELTPLNLGRPGLGSTVVGVAGFTHAIGAEDASAFTASINWGDGTTSSGTVALAPGNLYVVSGSHTYNDEKNFQIVVTVSEDNGAVSTTINSTAVILEEFLADGSRGTPDQRFINEVYRDLLGRKADTGGLSLWVGELNAGVSRAQVVKDIENSNEFRMDAVQALYQQYLHRTADQAGLNNDVAFLQSGGTLEQVIVGMTNSQEYYNRTNGTNDGWLDTFYQDALHRAVDPSGRQSWDQVFTLGFTRAQVAGFILASDEYRNDLIQSYYLRFLDRPADQGGQNVFLNAFKSGATDQDVSAGLIGSPSNEFYNKTAQ